MRYSFISSLLGAATAVRSGSCVGLPADIAPTKGASCACNTLSHTFKDVIFPNNSSYTTQVADKYWDVRANLSPACIFLPSSADEVSKAISIFGSCNAQFAVRGGGHMNVSLSLYNKVLMYFSKVS